MTHENKERLVKAVIMAFLGLVAWALWYLFASAFGCATNVASPREEQEIRPAQQIAPQHEQRTEIESGGDTEVTSRTEEHTTSRQETTTGLTGHDITRMQYVGIAAVVLFGGGLVAVAITAMRSQFKADAALREAMCAYTKGRAARLAIDARRAEPQMNADGHG